MFFTTTGFRCQEWEGESLVKRAVSLFREADVDEWILSPTPEAADAVLLMESVSYKERDYARFLTADSLFRANADKCFVYNYEDNPIAFLPGVYVSLGKRFHKRSQHRAGFYLDLHNRLCAAANEETNPDYLFSFRGNINSHPIRKQIISLEPEAGDSALLEETNSWYSHKDDELKRFVDGMIQSKYVLCPRGLGTASHRLFEAMAVGRAPVIISDEWVAPQGPDWNSFSVRVAEKDIHTLPGLLAEHSSEWQERGAKAKAEWERWFGPTSGVRTLLSCISELLDAPRPDIQTQIKEWEKDRFYRPYGQGFLQKGSRKLKELISRNDESRHK